MANATKKTARKIVKKKRNTTVADAQDVLIKILAYNYLKGVAIVIPFLF